MYGRGVVRGALRWVHGGGGAGRADRGVRVRCGRHGGAAWCTEGWMQSAGRAGEAAVGRAGKEGRRCEGAQLLMDGQVRCHAYQGWVACTALYGKRARCRATPPVATWTQASGG